VLGSSYIGREAPVAILDGKLMKQGRS